MPCPGTLMVAGPAVHLGDAQERLEYGKVRFWYAVSSASFLEAL